MAAEEAGGCLYSQQKKPPAPWPYRVGWPPSPVTSANKVPEMATMSQHLRWLPCHGAQDGHPAVAPKLATLLWHPRWQPHLSTTAPRMAALPQCHIGAYGQCAPMLELVLRKTSPFPARWGSSSCLSSWRTYPTHEVVGWGPPGG